MPKRKIIVSERDNIAALFEDDRAVEFIIHRGDMLLGDVYLATVENILPSIDAAFVNVGGDKMGFLHSSDVKGKGELSERIKPRQKVVVQVMKEPTGHKGPRVTTNISLPGRFLVLMPESRGISISRKVEQAKERARLKAVVSMIKPAGVGIIIRTEANNQKESDIQEDFETLIDRWQNIVASADTCTPPALLHRDQDLLYRVIREIVTEDVSELVVDTAFGQQRAQQLLQNWNMDKNITVSLHAGNQSIMIATGVDREIKLALQTKVPLPSGGYLYIQPTEALCVIDVNSGKFTSLKSQAETIRLTNLEACKEIARQLRLRNIGGMIIVDFIDMESRADQLSVLEAFENELAPDKSKPQMGQLTDLGLVEMTRHRQGQALSEIFTRSCGACHGTGHAVEEFNWAPPNIDGEIRTMGRPMRGNLPIRQSRGQGRDRSVPRPGSGGNFGRGGQQKPAAEGVLDAARGGRRPDRERGGMPPGNVLLRSRNGSPERSRGPLHKPLDEFFREKTFNEMGIHLAEAVKLARNPQGANSVLARINPKANDIQTLVISIESGEPIMPRRDERDDRSRGGHWRDRDRFRDDRPRRDEIAEDLDDEDIDDEDDTLEAETREPQEARLPAHTHPRRDGGKKDPFVLEDDDEDAADSDSDLPEFIDDDELPELDSETGPDDDDKPRRGARRGRPSRDVEASDSEEPDDDLVEVTAGVNGAAPEEASSESPGRRGDDKGKRRRGRPPKRSKIASKTPND